MEQILIIDDDLELCRLAGKFLKKEGFSSGAAHNGETGLKMALSGEYKIVILDVMLPKINGFDVLRSIRQKSNIPVIMLTARGEEMDRIIGLEIGADDYLPKPFHPRELTARLRAILRRQNPPELLSQHDENKLIRVGDVEIDTEQGQLNKTEI